VWHVSGGTRFRNYEDRQAGCVTDTLDMEGLKKMSEEWAAKGDGRIAQHDDVINSMKFMYVPQVRDQFSQ
jgi:hypothetical protein